MTATDAATADAATADGDTESAWTDGRHPWIGLALEERDDGVWLAFGRGDDDGTAVSIERGVDAICTADGRVAALRFARDPWSLACDPPGASAARALPQPRCEYSAAVDALTVQFVDYATHGPRGGADATSVCSVTADAAWLEDELILDVTDDGHYVAVEVLSASRTLCATPHRR